MAKNLSFKSVCVFVNHEKSLSGPHIGKLGAHRLCHRLMAGRIFRKTARCLVTWTSRAIFLRFRLADARHWPSPRATSGTSARWQTNVEWLNPSGDPDPLWPHVNTAAQTWFRPEVLPLPFPATCHFNLTKISTLYDIWTRVKSSLTLPNYILTVLL